MALVELIKDPTRRQLRQFGGLFLPLALTVVGVLARRSGAGTPVPLGLFLGAALSVLFAVVRPRLLLPVFLGLQVAALPFGFVLLHVLMAVVYYGVLTPVGLLLRVFRGDRLARRPDPGAATYWTSRKGPASIERYFRPY